uniref:Sensory protein kinase PcoS n=1 Tax=Klebsiella pneumoniae TaxID=573 RepID=A0A8B0STD9_KLEPN|nr:Sensory protein kinase PcoS [Klebsiella pneumoniae]
MYRSISRRVAVTPEQGKKQTCHHYGCHGYWVSHPVYGQTQYRAVLVQYRSGLYFCFFLGWLTTRIGLKPLREMTSLASSMTVHSPDQRLNPDLAPPEISETMQEFNNMFDRPGGGIPETVRFLV